MTEHLYDHAGQYDQTRTRVTVAIADDKSRATVWLRTECVGRGTWWRDVPAHVARKWAADALAGSGFELVPREARVNTQGWTYLYTTRPTGGLS